MLERLPPVGSRAAQALPAAGFFVRRLLLQRCAHESSNPHGCANPASTPPAAPCAHAAARSARVAAHCARVAAHSDPAAAHTHTPARRVRTHSPSPSASAVVSQFLVVSQIVPSAALRVCACGPALARRGAHGLRVRSSPTPRATHEPRRQSRGRPGWQRPGQRSSGVASGDCCTRNCASCMRG